MLPTLGKYVQSIRLPTTHQSNGRESPPCVSYKQKHDNINNLYPVEHERPALVRHGNDTYIIPAWNLPGYLIEDDDMSLDQAFAVIPIPPDLASAIRRADPPISEIGDPCNLNNYLPDSGATQHMTPCSADLINVVEGQNLGVEVADGHIIKCSTTGDVPIKMQDDDGEEFTATRPLF
jgi:hypothetical protein